MLRSFRSLRRWRPWQLLAAWCAYWLLLAAVALGPAVIAFLRSSNGPAGGQQVTVSFGDGALSASIKHLGAVVWSGSIHVLPLALWIAGPPLLLWLLWMVARGRGVESEQRVDARY